MILIALLIGVIILVAAIRNSQNALFSALATDVPGYVVWAAAIFAVGAIGFAPQLKPVSRGLLALVILVLILHNYKQVIAGFENAWKNPPKASGETVGAAPAASSNTGHSDPLGGFGGSNPLDAFTNIPMQISNIFGSSGSSDVLDIVNSGAQIASLAAFI